MRTAARPRRRLLALAVAATGTVAATVGLLLPSNAQAAVQYQTIAATNNRSVPYVCVSNCTAGGVGRIADGRSVLAMTNANPIGAAKVGPWSRTFIGTCKLNVGKARYLRGTVIDRNWSGTWQLNQTKFVNGNDLPLPWC